METSVQIHERWQDIGDLRAVIALIASAGIAREIESLLKAALDGNGQCVLTLARDGEACIAFAFANRGIGLESGGGYLWVNELFVKEEYRRRAVASTLLASLEAWARERNLKRIILAANPTNRAALALYGKAGFCVESAAWLEKELQDTRMT
ncbi:MAG: GNAT family N-acetyltransferase [Sphaerochaeta sp.]|nr:GNAT family N-acetyltransferase [Sphaerochaeta sp.]